MGGRLHDAIERVDEVTDVVHSLSLEAAELRFDGVDTAREVTSMEQVGQGGSDALKLREDRADIDIATVVHVDINADGREIEVEIRVEVEIESCNVVPLGNGDANVSIEAQNISMDARGETPLRTNTVDFWQGNLDWGQRADVDTCASGDVQREIPLQSNR